MANLENNNKNNENPRPHSDPDQVNVENARELVKDAIQHPVETAKEFTEQAARDVTNYKWWARLLLVIFWTGLFLIGAFLVIVNLPVTKNWTAQRVISSLNETMKSQIEFDSVDVNFFGDISIYNVRVRDHKQYHFLKAKKLYADSDWFSIIDNSRNLQFQSMSLTQMDLKVITYKNDSISNFIRFTNLFNQGERDSNKKPFELKSRILIGDSRISIVNQNSEGDHGKWLDAYNVNILIPELKVKGGDVSANINKMSFITSRWGKKHVVETLSANFALTDRYLSLQDLLLYTDHTLLQGDLKFNLPSTGFQDFTNRVHWDMTMENGSYVSGYDLSYFVTNWDNYKPVKMHGHMSGPLNDFRLNSFVIGNQDVNIFTHTMRLRNLLDGDFIIESNRLSTDFTYIGLKAMLPTFVSSRMKNFADDFGRLRYDGSVRVTPKEVYAPNATLTTGIGRAKLNNFYLRDFSTDLPKYKGKVDIWDLNTAAITKNNSVGLISGHVELDGQSFDVNTMRIRTKSNITKVEIAGKEINNLYLDGLLDHRTYFGIVNVNDEQAKANVKGLIDFKTSRIKADVDADVRYLNINYFTGATGNQIVSGVIDGKIAMTNLNDMDLDAKVSDLRFASGSKNYLIPNAEVRAFFENGNRIVAVNAPGAVEGKITGRYELGDLAGMIENGIGKILVGPPPRKLYRGQHFNMEFDVKQGLVDYFMQDLSIPKGAFVTGSYDGNGNNLVLNLDAADIKYIMTKKEEVTNADRVLAQINPDYQISEDDKIKRDSATATNLVVRINTANLDEQIFVRADRAQYSSNVFKDLTVTGRNENNQLLHIAANFLHGTPEEDKSEELKAYSINLNQSTNSAGDYVVRFEPTQVQFNNVAWNIDTNPELNHSITYRKASKDFLIENLRIYSEDSELLLRNAVFKSAQDFEGDAEVKNLQIGKLLEMTSDGNALEMEGIANGSIKIRMSGNNLEPIVDLNVNKITMKGDDLGDLIIKAQNSDVPNVFDIEAKVISAGIIGDNNLEVSGTINNNTASPTLDIKADMKDFDLKFANQFVKGVFSNMRGKANGILNITGTLKDIDYSGDIALNGFGMKLNFTGVDYSFEDTVVNLTRGAAVLNSIAVRDGRSNSSGTISGAIYFETLSSMAVELIMRADNLLVLNSTQADNDLFWGRVYGQGNLYVSGPVSSLKINTDSNEPFRALNNSVFTFNSNSNSNVDEFKMLRFLKQNEAGIIVTEEKARSGANMLVDFNLLVDRGTTVNVLVGDDIGDISVRGNANTLRFNMSRQGNISMNGTYQVESGTFVSKAILNRTFQIAKGSYISWDGNAMDPELDITANYLRTVANAGDYLNMSLQPIDVQLQTRITQSLTNPKIDLGVTAVDVSSQIKETLAGRMSQDDERVVQFGSILLMNRFNVASSGGLFSDVGSIAETSGYNLLFRQLGSVLNTISNEFQIDLNYVQGDQASNTGDRANAGVSVAFSPRLTVKTGLGIPLSRDAAQTDQRYLSGEGTIEYDVSKNNDGSLILRGYSKPMNIGMGTNAANNQAYGGGVVWTKSFERLFGGSKKQRKSKNSANNIKSDSLKNDTIE